jgi:DNA-binding NarL/FixJ family response regulator
MNKTEVNADKNAAEQKPRRVLIVDDHPLVREGLVRIIRSAGGLDVSGEAGSIPEAMQAIAAQKPDMVLLDLSLPQGSGLELLKDLQIQHPDLPVLVLSMHDEKFYAERALRAGARGYIMKQEPSASVVEAIRTVLRGGLYVSPSISAGILEKFAGGSRDPEKQTGVERLSNRELQVFECIGHGRSTQEIASQLKLSIKTIQAHREHIKEKIGVRSSTDLAHHAIRWVEAASGQAHPKNPQPFCAATAR